MNRDRLICQRPPEFLEIVRSVGCCEVVRQAEAQQQGNAGDQIGVAAEVEVDQQAVAIHAQQHLLGAGTARSVEHRIDPLAAKPGTEEEQLDHRHGDQPQRPLRLQHLTHRLGANLRQHVQGPIDRAGHQAWEKRQIQGKVQRRHRAQLATVDRDQVTDRVKGIERQPDRHQQFDDGQRHIKAKRSQGVLCAADEELLILE
ncbi:hypothetical protein [Pseudomonas plecoglossicida]|uniref:hypothetical protein n=1 Tax=Pseudomonas plecoglossicida TaxID=70775 RepID=UPI002158D8DC|nr:hypothetical protein [Pseudomonas plecoglossicida]